MHASVGASTGAAARAPGAGGGWTGGGGSVPVAGLWLLVALLACLTPITDQDLGFHIAWGRILLHDFRGAGSLLLGQDRSVTVYAYSYWLYQILVATLFDHAGPWAIVLLRTILVLGSFALAFGVVRRRQASAASRTLLLALGIVLASERFTDRPDVFSQLAWVATLWILVRHRRDRGLWALVPLQVLWVNMHHHFTLLLLAFGAFAVGDLCDGRRAPATVSPPAPAPARAQDEDLWKRAGLVGAALLLATLVNPVGPAAWRSQFKLAGIFSGQVSPITLTEHLGAFASANPFFSLWVFRITLPLLLLLALAGRRRTGWGPVLALLLPAALAIIARRAISFFALTALALLPPALDELLARVPASAAARLRQITLGVLAALALAVVGGLANGRIFLAQDKDLRLGAVEPFAFPGTSAARFLQQQHIEGPILHNPTAAGAILMENGSRLTPFLDPRWCGTAEENSLYLRLTHAGDADIAGIWNGAQATHGFETVLLDCYEMPALLRLLVQSPPQWALVHLDDNMAVFCRRGGRSDEAILRCEPELRASRAAAGPELEEALGRAVVQSLGRRAPSIFTPLHFPSAAFRRANFALQIGDLPDAEAAYRDLYGAEGGALRLSPHRREVLGNTLWCLGRSRQWDAIAALCASLAAEPGGDPDSRRRLRLLQSQSLLQAGQTATAARLATAIAEESGAAPEERASADGVLAGAREADGDHAGALAALQSAIALRPDVPEYYRSLGAILDLKLSRPDEALAAYRKFSSLGGKDPAVEARLEVLARAAPH